MTWRSEYHTSRTARTALKWHRCASDQQQIAPGDRYLRVVIFPGHDIAVDRPTESKECVSCAIDAGREGQTGACQSYCCSTVPCPLPHRHAGDHRCHRCHTPPEEPTEETR
jgi:hypothetical protein